METNKPQIIEVHNVWTIYGMNPDGTEAEEPLAALSRPQDWGDPSWFYERFQFTWFTEETTYINNCHCWTDLKRERWHYAELFASLVIQFLQPGCDPRECDRRYLKPEDFWHSDWGKTPHVFDPEYDVVYDSKHGYVEEA